MEVEKRDEYLCSGYNAALPSTVTDGNEEGCAKQCYATPACVAWTFDTSSGGCWLKTISDCRGAGAGWVWGTKDCGKYITG